MLAALAVHQVTNNENANLAAMTAMIAEAAAAKAELVLFPEAALTGLINNDAPLHDLPLGQTLAGNFVSVMIGLAQKHHLWIGTGFLEREENQLYDSAVLISPAGQIALHYRRIQPQWHGRHANPAIYRQGNKVVKAETPFGDCVFLICGDLFDDAVIAQVRALQPDLLLYPFARCFSDGTHDQDRWKKSELPDYIARIKLIECNALMVNYIAERSLEGGAFGGAISVRKDGTIAASQPLGKTGLLFATLE